MITPEKILRLSCDRFLCRIFGPSRTKEKWCPYITFDPGAKPPPPLGGKYHLYCERCGRGAPCSDWMEAPISDHA